MEGFLTFLVTKFPLASYYGCHWKETQNNGLAETVDRKCLRTVSMFKWLKALRSLYLKFF